MNTQTNLDDILDGTLDDLADAPEFKNFPNGAHVVTIKFERKEINGKKAVQANMVGISTEELSDPKADVPITKGDEASVLFMLDNEYGQGDLKKTLAPFAEVHGNMKLGELMEAANGSEVLVVTTQRANKDKTKLYMSISSLKVI